MVVQFSNNDVFLAPKRRSSGFFEDKHEKASRLMLAGIALEQKDQLKNVIRSVREHPGVLASVVGLLKDMSSRRHRCVRWRRTITSRVSESCTSWIFNNSLASVSEEPSAQRISKTC